MAKTKTLKKYSQRELANKLQKRDYLSSFSVLNMPKKGDVVVHKRFGFGRVTKVKISEYTVRFEEPNRELEFVIGEDVSKVEDLNFYRQLKEASKSQKQRRLESNVAGKKVLGVRGLRRELRRGLLTTAEVKEIMGFTSAKLNKIIKSGDLTTQKLKGRIYIDETDLKNWAKKQLKPLSKSH